MTLRRVGDRDVEVTSLDRVLFPAAGITKGDLLAYVEDVGALMLPQLRGRPVALKRYPEGLAGEGFFQKSRPDGAPAWLGGVDVPLRQGGTKRHATVDDVAGIVYLANLGTIEFHRWLSCADRLEVPDQLVFDLDPPDGTDVREVRWAARAVRDLLEDELGLATLVKTSGSKGFHVHVPLASTAGFDDARAFADGAAGVLAARHPGRLTTETRKAERRGRILLDVGRNAYGQTVVAAYSVRARPGAPVATPIDWDELSDVHPQRYTVANLRRRLGQKEDPWTAARVAGAPLDEARQRLDELRAEEAP